MANAIKTFFAHSEISVMPRAYKVASDEIFAAGLRVSVGSYIDTARKMFCIFSVETHGPATYGSPRMCITGTLSDATCRGLEERN